MKTLFYTVQSYDQEFLEAAAKVIPLEYKALDSNIDDSTIDFAEGFEAISIFGTDALPKEYIEKLHKFGVKLISARCAGYNAIDLETAKSYGMHAVYVPSYSPEAIAEHVVGMILNLSRKFHISYNHMKEGNFSISQLLGFNLHKKVVGIIGAGKIGTALARILTGFGCKVLAYDPYPNDACKKLGVEYLPLDEVLSSSDILSLNLAITESTYHMINPSALKKMKKGVIIINTGRGGLIDTEALIDEIKSGHVGHVGLDVYEWEKDYFHNDLSSSIVSDDQLARLLFFPNVMITSHQAYFTRESLQEIWMTTFQNIKDMMEDGKCVNQLI